MGARLKQGAPIGDLLCHHAIGFIATFADDECVTLSYRDNSSVLPIAMKRAARNISGVRKIG
jgi:hypothetical protein